MVSKALSNGYVFVALKSTVISHVNNHGFMQFCYEPIKQIINTCMNDQKNKFWPMLQKLGITMKFEEKDLQLIKPVMQTWLPASTSLLEMMIFHLPSFLYEGPLGDQYATVIGTVILNVASDLPKLVEGMKHLAKSDPMVVAGELHLEICQKDIQDDLMGGAEFIKYDPTVPSTKSPNKHNRLYMEARSLEEGLVEAIDEGCIGPRDDPTDLAKKIWCFGPETTGPNMFIDTCKGVQYLNEFKDSVVTGFWWSSKEGALAKKNMRGICYEVCDVVLHDVSIHRGGGQITSKPRLLEPVYLVEIQANAPNIFSPNDISIPLAFPQCVFDHWDMMSSESLEVGSEAATLVTEIRKRKGLKEQMMPLSEFKDRM
ncbi:hypothetical protein UlMin_026729 [Ulmus minor]